MHGINMNRSFLLVIAHERGTEQQLSCIRTIYIYTGRDQINGGWISTLARFWRANEWMDLTRTCRGSGRPRKKWGKKTSATNSPFLKTLKNRFWTWAEHATHCTTCARLDAVIKFLRRKKGREYISTSLDDLMIPWIGAPSFISLKNRSVFPN